jgi:predicted nucleic-acid-binding protein
MRAVDTNVLVRLIARDDAEQSATAERFVAPGAWVSQIVLVETLWVLDAVFGLAPEKIARAVDMLLEHSQLTLQEPEIIAAALERERHLAAVQPLLQRRLVQLRRQGPADAGLTRSLDALLHRRARAADGNANLPVAEPRGLEPQYVTYFAHG